ncbi:efflux RND transporter permease subunit [Salipiger sp. 1_MG-2023]|uniref:efflux RND transporter permease subunit n=1 Tax=Salipiger sp. 1_MG-2023 TaxID=3062665 RepID=UPI0026E15AFC|nr:efflux RND transporter permease subunit [Salipiger sp. 1_MG-2023]MDO6585151.1 efflux RND transporter permease subunit [Salipiger sp. 1_MG-2023]
MSLPDLSIRRPVLATVLNLLIVLIGAVAISRLPVRELPSTDTARVTVSVDYTGAAPDVVDTQIAAVIEGALAGISGLQSMETESERGRARTVLIFDSAVDIDSATNDVRTALDRAARDLPDAADAPQVRKNDSESDPVVRLSLASSEMSALELSDYANRFIVDRLARLPGVANASVYGERAPAMRIWLDAGLMAAHGVTTGDIISALDANNVELPAGEIETGARQLSLLARTRFTGPEEFANLAVRDDGARPLRLGDVARIEEAPEASESLFRSDGATGLGLGIQPQAQANTVAISRAIKAELDLIRPGLPSGMSLTITTDEALFIQTTLNEVKDVFIEAVLLVTAVIFLFLGSARLSLVPIVTIPVSILGAGLAMLLLGFTINIITLFAMILAIGLVVDDAIVVLENIQRHRAMGYSPREAARAGANQVNFAVIATTAVLIAVFLPVSFMDGEIGQIFGEFGIVLAVAVVVSGFTALTLSPVLAARLMPAEDKPNLLTRAVNAVIRVVERGYRRGLGAMLKLPELLLGGTAFAVAACAALYLSLPQEVTPKEDRGQFRIYVTAPQGSSLEVTDAAARQVEAALQPLRDRGAVSNVTTIVGMWGELRRAMLFVNLVPWDERDISVQDAMAGLRAPLAGITDVQTWMRPSGGLGIGSGRGGLQFFLGGPDIDTAADWANSLAAVLEDDPDLSGVEVGHAADQPGATLSVDRLRAQDLGLDAQTVSSTLQVLIASRTVGEFSRDGRQYPVVLQAAPEDRDAPEDLMSILLRNDRGALIPLSAFASLETAATVPSITRYDRVHSVGVESDMTTGADLAQVMARVQAAVADLPAGATLAWDGQAADYLKSSGDMGMVFAMAMAIVFLVLAAQFESFRTPLTILLTVPLGLGGAVLTLWLTGQSINIFSQIGLVLLVGLMAKNGILMVEFSNQLREEGMALRAAAIEGAVTRLRPVTMTTVATILGAVPLATATGAGAESRVAIGMVITGGLALAFVLTLFVTPVIYVIVEGILPRRDPEPDPVPAQ